MKKFIGITLLIILVSGACTNNNRSFQKSPVDKIIRDLSNEQSFSVILYDMDYQESGNQYRHQYQILTDRPDTVLQKITQWMPVSEPFFNTHIDNMGMEIVSKTNGQLNKVAAPAGYSNYVGNEKYGQWKQRDGGSFWEFYGKYMFMTSMFRMATMPIRHSYYNDYHNNYHRQRRPYYGPMNTNGSRMYGTSGSYNKSRTNATWNNKPNTFKQKVRSKASRSSSSSFYGNKSKSSSARKSRSSSRYKSSNYRSRGGSFGK